MTSLTKLSLANRLLVGLVKRQREHGGSVLLRGADARTARMLRITGLDAVFPDAEAGAEP